METTNPYIPRIPDMITGSRDVITRLGRNIDAAAIAPPDLAVPYDAPIAKGDSSHVPDKTIDAVIPAKPKNGAYKGQYWSIKSISLDDML